jgi:sulfur-oxidizing protein SoxY
VKRRQVLKGLAGGVAIFAWPTPGLALPEDATRAIQALFGDRPLQEGRVVVELPKLSENGYSVAMAIDVDSPMTENDHVSRIAVFAEENPLPDVVRFELGPRAGRASIKTRIRLGASQRIRAVAQMNDGSLWTSYAFTVVTLAACVVQG